MVKNENLPMPAAGQPQMIAFTVSAGDSKIIPWLHVNGEWVRQADVLAGELVAIGLENDLLTLKRAADGCSGN